MKRLTRPGIRPGVNARVGMAAGIAYFVCHLVSLPLKGDLPGVDAPVEEVVGYYTGQATGIGLYAAFGLVGVAFLVWFLGSLRVALSRSSMPHLAEVTYLAGALLAVTTLGSIAAYGPASFVVDMSEVEEAAVRALHGVTFLSDGFFAVAVTAKAVLIISLSLASVTGGFLPRWIGWLGIVLGAACLVGIFSFTEGAQPGPLTAVFFAASIGAHVWILLAGIALTIRPTGYGAAAEGPGLDGPVLGATTAR